MPRDGVLSQCIPNQGRVHRDACAGRSRAALDRVPLNLVCASTGVEDRNGIGPVERNNIAQGGRCSPYLRVWCSIDAQAGVVVAKRRRSRGVRSNQISLNGGAASAAGFIDSIYVTASAATAAADSYPGKANIPGNDVS